MEALFSTIIPTAFGLSMDAAAVSISNGLAMRRIKMLKVFYMALAFGLAQGIMPLIGYAVGYLMENLIMAVDHWLALILLAFIGGKMIFAAIKEMKNPEALKAGQQLTFKTIFLQAIATSIDALAVGVSFAALKINIFLTSATIAFITFICCLAAVFVGKIFGSALKEKAEILGGLVLIFIGLKIFIEHVFLG